MIRTYAMVPHGPKSSQSASSCVSNGRLPRNTLLLLSRLPALLLPTSPAASIRRCRPNATAPLSATALRSDSTDAKTTYALTASRTVASNSRLITAAFCVIFGLAAAAERMRTDSTGPYFEKCRESACRSTSSGRLPTNAVRASRSGSSSLGKLSFCFCLPSASASSGTAFPFFGLPSAGTWSRTGFAFFAAGPSFCATGPSSSVDMSTIFSSSAPVSFFPAFSFFAAFSFFTFSFFMATFVLSSAGAASVCVTSTTLVPRCRLREMG
mmetsp:Transcript_15740/g.35300  ORF Transcript_15740/g.35300 Transcript_15740/m.35300 type:complete len:268 (-) Transcript_15740:62-865(-)